MADWNRFGQIVGAAFALVALAGPNASAQSAPPEVAASDEGAQAEELSEVVEAATPPTAGYDGGFFIRSPDEPFQLKLQGRVQTRFTHEIPDGGNADSAFSIPRARLTLGGRAFAEELTYKFQADFGKGFVTLKDFYVDYAFLPGHLQLRIGQFKRPFSRQQLNSSGRLELVDRAITDRYFGGGRDIGIMLHNNFTRAAGVEWAVGVFNGTGDKSRFSGDAEVDLATGEGEVSGSFSNVPDQLDPALAVRIGFNHGGIRGYREADLEGGPVRFAAAAGVLADLDGDHDDDSRVIGGFDFVFKVAGFSTTGAAYIASEQQGDGFGDRGLDAIGGHIQAGYVIAGCVQPALRYAVVAPDGENNDVSEIMGGISAYFFGHSVKWQTDGGVLISETEDGNETDALVRSQLQLSF